jgi:hypothetical protein
MKNLSVSDLISRFQPGNSQFKKLLLRDKKISKSIEKLELFEYEVTKLEFGNQ